MHQPRTVSTSRGRAAGRRRRPTSSWSRTSRLWRSAWSRRWGPGVGSGSRRGSRIRVPMEIEVGDRVLFDRYAGTDVEVGLDDKHTLLSQSEVLAVIRAAQA